jgi:hypothetical protein
MLAELRLQATLIAYRIAAAAAIAVLVTVMHSGPAGIDAARQLTDQSTTIRVVV